MKLVVVAALIVVIALLGSRISFGRIRLPLGVENLLLSGSEYVLVGLLLGTSVLNLLDAPTLLGLYPFLGLGLSWIGMLFGIQWEFRRLVRIPVQVFGIAMVQALVTMAAVAAGFYVMFWYLVPGNDGNIFICALTLAAAASGTAQSGLALAVRNAPASWRSGIRLLQNVSHLDDLIGVVVFGLILCLTVPDGTLSGAIWVGISIGLGLVVGMMMVVLTTFRLRGEELLLVVLGGVVFSGGLALYLSLSPLLVNLVAGVVLANLARGRALSGIRRVLLEGERSIYVLFLILVGAGWKPGSAWIPVFVLAYLMVRTLGKALGGYVSARAFLPASAPFNGLGLGLLSHGGMAVAIVVNLHLVHPSGLTDMVISVVLLGMLAGELFSPALTRRLLQGAS